MKKQPLLRLLLPTIIVFLGIAALSALITPWAPLLLIASLGIQLPVIYVITKVNFTAGYRDRAYERRTAFEKDGDAATWMAGEQKEAASVGFRYLSAGGRAQCTLNRADALSHLERKDEAAAMLAEINEGKLSKQDRARYAEIAARMTEHQSD